MEKQKAFLYFTACHIIVIINFELESHVIIKYMQYTIGRDVQLQIVFLYLYFL